MEKEILRLAKEARKISEDQAASEGFAKDLCGFCAKGSVILFDILKGRGYNPVIAVSERVPHVFVIVKDHVIDITATQYKDSYRKKVFVTKYPNEMNRYRADEIFYSSEELIEYQNETCWVEWQIP